MLHCLVLRVQALEKRKSGDDSKEDPPVPMPNTEVKLLNVDDTWRVTAWESRKLPGLGNTKEKSLVFDIFLYSSVGRAHDC